MQIREICRISDELNIPSMCYGIRTDFQGKLFEGSSELLALADNLIELKTVCDCGRKAIMVVRLNEDGSVVTDGDQIKIGGNDSYKVYCRKHFRELTNLI
jgi:thymidine kinase